MLVAQFKHVITYYQKFCDESCQPLSECALYRILNDLNPWQQKSLAGLDDTTAYGLNGFRSLENVIINFLGWKKKHYLPNWSTQIVYPQNCMEHSDCPSHYISFALSDPKGPNLAKNALVRIALTCTNWLMKLPLLLMV